MNIDQPSIARIYDYTLGGMANFAVDREVADEFIRLCPWQVTYARENRDFLRRAVASLVDAGIDQFLDLGSGIPTVGNVHEIAHRSEPTASVAYVDIDPVAVQLARGLLDAAGAPEGVTATDVDMRDPGAVLAAPGVADLIDFSRPVGVLMLGILDIIDHPDPAALVAAYRDACPSGSALVISNGAQLSMTDEQRLIAEEMMSQTSTPVLTARTADQVRVMYEGYALWEPGIVPTAGWRPDRPVPEGALGGCNCLCGVGTLP